MKVSAWAYSILNSYLAHSQSFRRHILTLKPNTVAFETVVWRIHFQNDKKVCNQKEYIHQEEIFCHFYWVGGTCWIVLDGSFEYLQRIKWLGAVWAEKLNTFGFGYDFSIARTTRGERKRQSLKVINTEYYVADEFALLGTIGGYLGTAYGFSIWGTAVSIINYIQRFIVKVQS